MWTSLSQIELFGLLLNINYKYSPQNIDFNQFQWNLIWFEICFKKYIYEMTKNIIIGTKCFF